MQWNQFRWFGTAGNDDGHKQDFANGLEMETFKIRGNAHENYG